MKKCDYCDFVSYAGKEELIDEYVDFLVKEINSPPLSPSLNKRGGLTTIYFGGGTPTVLSHDHFCKIIGAVMSNAECRMPNSEITVEANPGTVNKEYLKRLRDLGINRISLGAQSFNDQHLKALGRIHNSKQIYQAVEDARAAGFENINLDLIFALPDQTVDDLKDDIKQALSLKPDHLSTYNLQIEEGTPLWERTKNQTTNNKQYQDHNIQIPSEDEEADMYEFIIDTLTSNGYKHYEISNFAKPGLECRHNINYWLNGNYIGIGAGAHSHVNGKRWANTESIEEYIRDAIRDTQNETHLATAQHDTLFMGLRLLDGIPADKFLGFEPQLASLIDQGLIERHNNNIRLTKKGLFLGNLVFEQFV